MSAVMRTHFVPRGTAKKAWSSSEDALLLDLIVEHGASNWSLIAEKLVNRTGKQCRERYHNHLNPEVKKGDWTEAEDILLAELHAKLGNQWAKIAKSLPGRTDNAIKNRYHTAHRPLMEEEPAVPVHSFVQPTSTARMNSSSSSSSSAKPSNSKASKKHGDLVPVLDLAAVTIVDHRVYEEADYGYDHAHHSHEVTLTSRTQEGDEESVSLKWDNNKPKSMTTAFDASSIFALSARCMMENNSGCASAPSPCLQYWLKQRKTLSLQLSDLSCTESCFGGDTARSFLLTDRNNYSNHNDNDTDSESASSSSSARSRSNNDNDDVTPLDLPAPYSFTHNTLRLDIDTLEYSPTSTESDCFFADENDSAFASSGDEGEDDLEFDLELVPSSAVAFGVTIGYAHAAAPSPMRQQQQEQQQQLKSKCAPAMSQSTSNMWQLQRSPFLVSPSAASMDQKRRKRM